MSLFHSTWVTQSTATPHQRVLRRLVPLFLVCYFFAHLDRINIGFAKVQMAQALELSDSAYGFGAGLCFVAYVLFAVPSNALLAKYGARRWIALLMGCWGLLSAATMWVQADWQFYLLRFLLGVAEAGFFPGILLVINRWFPAGWRGKVTAMFTLAVPLAGILGGPISGAILQHFDRIAGLRGWQWMLLIEGIPAIALGVLVLRYLPDDIASANWLSAEEKQQIQRELAQEERSKPSATSDLRGRLADLQLWLLGGIFFAVMVAINTLAFWAPALIHGAGVGNDADVGLLSALPYLAGVAFMLVCGFSSDRRNERRWHLTVPLLLAAVGLAMAGLQPTRLEFVLTGLTVAGMGAIASFPMFWQLPSAYLARAAQPLGIALISSIGNIASFLTPYLIGLMRDYLPGSGTALYLISLAMVFGALLAVISKAPDRHRWVRPSG